MKAGQELYVTSLYVMEIAMEEGFVLNQTSKFYLSSSLYYNAYMFIFQDYLDYVYVTTLTLYHYDVYLADVGVIPTMVEMTVPSAASLVWQSLA